MKENTIITIGRQFGSGGREIAETLAKKLGFRCYDLQILYRAAEQIGGEEADLESLKDILNPYKMTCYLKDLPVTCNLPLMRIDEPG
jgi:cytidylate kinase